MATTTDEPTLEARTRVVIESLSVDLTGVGSLRTRPVRAVARPVAKSCSGSAAPSVHGGRLTRRGRLVMSAAWLVLLVVGVLGVVRPWAGAPEPGEVAERATVRIDPGDTLWDVAGRVAPESDRREVVSAIVEMNDLSSAGDIRPGDRLVLPDAR